MGRPLPPQLSGRGASSSHQRPPSPVVPRCVPRTSSGYSQGLQSPSMKDRHRPMGGAPTGPAHPQDQGMAAGWGGGRESGGWSGVGWGEFLAGAAWVSWSPAVPSTQGGPGKALGPCWPWALASLLVTVLKPKTPHQSQMAWWLGGGGVEAGLLSWELTCRQEPAACTCPSTWWTRGAPALQPPELTDHCPEAQPARAPAPSHHHGWKRR